MRSASVVDPLLLAVPKEIYPAVPSFSLLLITKPPDLYLTKSADDESVPSLSLVSNLKIEPALLPVLKFATSRYLRVSPGSSAVPI